MASSYHQLGALATVQGRPEEGLASSLAALSTFLELQVPEVVIVLKLLHRQRELLGDERFGELLREHVGEEGAEVVLGLLTQAPP